MASRPPAGQYVLELRAVVAASRRPSVCETGCWSRSRASTAGPLPPAQSWRRAPLPACRSPRTPRRSGHGWSGSHGQRSAVMPSGTRGFPISHRLSASNASVRYTSIPWDLNSRTSCRIARSENANLNGADLRGADLSYVTMDGAYLGRAILNGATMIERTGVRRQRTTT